MFFGRLFPAVSWSLAASTVFWEGIWLWYPQRRLPVRFLPVSWIAVSPDAAASTVCLRSGARNIPEVKMFVLQVSGTGSGP